MNNQSTTANERKGEKELADSAREEEQDRPLTFTPLSNTRALEILGLSSTPTLLDVATAVWAAWDPDTVSFPSFVLTTARS